MALSASSPLPHLKIVQLVRYIIKQQVTVVRAVKQQLLDTCIILSTQT